MTVLLIVLSSIDLFVPVPFIYYFSSLRQFRLSLLVGAGPSSYRRKIALMSDRKWQTGGGQRKRKKLVSKGKLISGHFVSTRSQSSSALSLPLLYIEYSFLRSIIRFPMSNPADPITYEKTSNDRIYIVVYGKKDQESHCTR